MYNQFIWKNRDFLKKLYNRNIFIIILFFSLFLTYKFNKFLFENNFKNIIISPILIYSVLLLFPFACTFFYNILVLERIKEIEKYFLERKFNLYEKSISNLKGFVWFHPEFAFQGDYYRGIYKSHFVVISIDNINYEICLDWYEKKAFSFDEEDLLDCKLKSKIVNFDLELNIQQTLEIGPYQ